MLVLDEQRLKRNAKGAAQEAVAQQINDWTMEQLRNARVVHDLDLSPSNPERQMGKMLPGPAALEQQLSRESANFVFENVPGNPTKKRLFYARPGASNADAGRDFLGLYENGPMPEWSIMTATWKWIPDPDFELGGKVLDRSDLLAKPVSLQDAHDLISKHGVSGAKTELLKRRNDTVDPDVKPGFIKQLETTREAIRGWRTVLVRPLQAGYLTLAQTEAIAARLSGGDVRANWARATGNKSVAMTI